MKLTLYFLLIIAFTSVYAQNVVISKDESVADPSAILDIQSDSKGLLIPRMTITERLAIEDPAEGLLVYQTDDVSGIYYYDGNLWSAFYSAKQIKALGSGKIISDEERALLVSAVQDEADPQFNASEAAKISDAGRGKVLSEAELDDIYSGFNYPKIAILKDVKSPNAYGGASVGGSWLDRVLNTIDGDDSFVELQGGTTGTDGTSTQFKLSAGRYHIWAMAPAYWAERHTARLYNLTKNEVVEIGTAAFIGPNDTGVNSSSFVQAVIEITEETSFVIQHKTTNSHSDAGFGTYGSSGSEEVYTVVTIMKMK